MKVLNTCQTAVICVKYWLKLKDSCKSMLIHITLHCYQFCSRVSLSMMP